MSAGDCFAAASFLVWMLVIGMYACGMTDSVIWLFALVGLLLFLIANALMLHSFGNILSDIKKIERDITKHYKERGW